MAKNGRKWRRKCQKLKNRAKRSWTGPKIVKNRPKNLNEPVHAFKENWTGQPRRVRGVWPGSLISPLPFASAFSLLLTRYQPTETQNSTIIIFPIFIPRLSLFQHIILIHQPPAFHAATPRQHLLLAFISIVHAYHQIDGREALGFGYKGLRKTPLKVIRKLGNLG